MKKRQAHKNIPEGHFEEEQGQGGFYGAVSHLIKKKPSTRWSHIKGNLKPRLFQLMQLQQEWTSLFYNDYLEICFFKIKQARFACRDADGDLLYFCHQGEGVVLTEYGLLNYYAGQYIVIPKCLTHFIIPHKPTDFFVVKSLKAHLRQPDRGLLGRNALYDSTALIKPDLKKLQDYLKKNQLEVKEVVVYHQKEQTVFSYEECIFDVVEWKGDLFPYTLDTKDIMPVMSHRVHLPPSVHSTFLTDDFIICTFLPRPLEQDADALKIPFYHQNTDYDEVLFYHDGDFFSRDNLEAGAMSFHPVGFPHGPHPKAVQNIKGKTFTNETAVMIDSRWPLKQSKSLKDIEAADYWKSWQSKS